MLSILGCITYLSQSLNQTRDPHEKQILENIINVYSDLYINYGLDVINRIPDDKIFLNKFENHVYSQFREDGITEKIFETIGFTNKFYVDFGATDTTNNSEILHKKHGFNGVLWNCDDTPCHYTTIYKERINSENVTDLFKKYSVPKEFDFLSIDVDFNDWYIFRNICKEYHPRVIITEYNSTFPPPEDKIVMYDPNGSWNEDTYYGASIQAFYNLARSLGYSLVASESMGVNLFFIRDDINSDMFYGKNDVNILYRTPKHGHSPCGQNGQHSTECMKIYGMDKICGHKPHTEELKWTNSTIA